MTNVGGRMSLSLVDVGVTSYRHPQHQERITMVSGAMSYECSLGSRPEQPASLRMRPQKMQAFGPTCCSVDSAPGGCAISGLSLRIYIHEAFSQCVCVLDVAQPS
ncbi:hypothetical protein PUNSTDRAFT_54147 [Punctularia strigosozonata HHB-11173 SS5]|uniref:uncharacterized protein n=1 Tax=Punctularia strigosozonata (strain HHB-11173) TaxID=741275 RepID=UPI00044173DB|nr:uncharacterized protein PUNSTDRAFT_54147 [Punctularia strigosozonata HHB-11173 SS5]EIN06758.1 hypothetical protein PUNSTDRAFT_54147 [Punctularia strigosozonata HHB-11173 SS5]